MSWRGAAAWVAAFAALVAIASQAIDEPPTQQRKPDRSSPEAQRSVTVLRAVDGDTILVRGSGGRTERVRYIGIDTPESVKPNSPVECYGHEASAFNRSLVEGKKVRLVPDQEPEDRFGRTLAFVYVNGTLVNAELLRRGYARTIEIEPNTSRADYFAELQRVAIRTKKGLWKACSR